MNGIKDTIEFLWTMTRMKLVPILHGTPDLPGGKLDEQTALMRHGQRLMGEKLLNSGTPTRAREDFNATMRMLRPAGGLFEKVHVVRDMEIPGPAGRLPARLYLPGDDQNYPVFVFLHGGGFVLGTLESGDNMARFLCRHAQCVVVSLDYRLAPENPFPAAVEDSLAAVRWVLEHARELGGDPQRCLVGGDSAGGTLSAVVAQLARGNAIPLKGQCLFYPATDISSLETPSYHAFGGGAFGLPKADVEWFMDQYVPPAIDRRDPRLSPLLEPDLSGLPPALVASAEFDVLRDEGELYAMRMQEAGVAVKIMRCNGMVHGFLSTIGIIRRSNIYFQQIATEIRRMAGE